MNVEDAAHRLGHEYPGGAKALAERLGINQAVFNSKLNPNTATHHLTLVESVRMQQLAGRFDVLYAMADALDHVAIPKPQVADTDLGRAISKACAEFGDFLRQIDDTLRDKSVTPNEVRRAEKELVEMIAAANHLLGLVSGKIAGRVPYKGAR